MGTAFSFFLLLLLSMHVNLAREISKGVASNIETAYDAQEKVDDHLLLNHVHDDHDGDDQHVHAHASPSSSRPHMDPSMNMFFHIDDLKIGQKVPLYFPIKNPSSSSLSLHMIPKQEANSIPFSLSQLPQILDFFSFSQNSPQAKAIKETLAHCEFPPIKGETKFCATSLESMLDNLALIFGLGNNFKVLTTTHVTNLTHSLQNYTVLDAPREIYVTKAVGCHPMAYPYAVFYCHSQERDNKLFMISLEGEKDGLRLEAVGMCHMDTSGWDPNHVSFRVLGVKPGTSPVCHVFPQDNLVWVSSSSSVE